MSPEQSGNDDDLYCKPCPESSSKGVHDVPSTAEDALTEPDTETDAATRTKPSIPFPLKAIYPPPHLSISNEWAAIDENYTLYEAQKFDDDRARLAAEISWREKEFERLTYMCIKGVTVRFAGPMRFALVSQLADHPDLLLRHFQNERRIIRANQWLELRYTPNKDVNSATSTTKN
jgi:hypothetical protein